MTKLQVVKILGNKIQFLEEFSQLSFRENLYANKDYRHVFCKIATKIIRFNLTLAVGRCCGSRQRTLGVSASGGISGSVCWDTVLKLFNKLYYSSPTWMLNK